MMTLLELAERCEKAEGPDREIDCLIAEALNPDLKPEDRVMYYGEPTGEHVDHREDRAFIKSPAYTASIDAALTLVPNGNRDPQGVMHEALRSLGRRFNLHMSWWPLATPYNEYLARHVCAAALRARAAQAGDEQ